MKWKALLLAGIAIAGCRAEAESQNNHPPQNLNTATGTIELPERPDLFSKALGINPELTSTMDFSLTEPDIGSEIIKIARRYEQTPYGRSDGQFVCVSFVEQVLLEMGLYTHDVFQRRIYNSRRIPINWADRNWDNPDVDGIAAALVAERYADPVEPWTDAEPGDFIQIWRDYGSRGHAAIVEENHLDVNSPTYKAPSWDPDYGPYLLLYGASSYPGRGKCMTGTKGCVTSARSRNLFDPGVKVMVARIRPDAVGYE